MMNTGCEVRVNSDLNNILDIYTNLEPMLYSLASTLLHRKLLSIEA